MGKIWEFLKSIFAPLSEEEAWEIGVITPQMRRDPITETRLKSIKPQNEAEELRKAEIEMEQQNADEAGVVRKK